MKGKFHRINDNTLGFIFEDKMYTYSKKGKLWNVGGAKSNYFDKYDDLNSISLAFYKSWAWAFRGMVSKTFFITFNKIVDIINLSPDWTIELSGSQKRN